MRACALAVTLLLALGCTNPAFIEASAMVCANGADDDGNGLTDCDDPACNASGVCETTRFACENELDDDGDGATDCAESTCRALGVCDAFLTDCSVLPQSGCPAGMGCYRTFRGAAESQSGCRAGGAGTVGTACRFADIDGLGAADAHPCAIGTTCVALGAVGTCGAYCDGDAECPAGGLCRPAPVVTGRSGACTTPCDPRTLGSCGPELACVSFHELGETYARGSAHWGCFDASLARGSAGDGEPCVDGPDPGAPTDTVCRSAFACVPDAGGATCRRLCDVGAPDCPHGRACVALPLGEDDRPPGVGSIVFGTCA